MIDYLERLFQTQPVPAEKRASEPAEVSAVPAAAEHAAPEVSTNLPQRGESFWQEEALRRVERALEVPEGAAASTVIKRPEQPRAGEDLERRLRRDSRRYDSGFYSY